MLELSDKVYKTAIIIMVSELRAQLGKEWNDRCSQQRTISHEEPNGNSWTEKHNNRNKINWNEEMIKYKNRYYSGKSLWTWRLIDKKISSEQ